MDGQFGVLSTSGPPVEGTIGASEKCREFYKPLTTFFNQISLAPTTDRRFARSSRYHQGDRRAQRGWVRLLAEDFDAG
jgi:hypothetical protein